MEFVFEPGDRMNHRRMTILALAAATLLVAGCGGDDEQSTAGDDAEQPAATEEAPGGGTLDLTVSSAGEGRFALDAPDSVPGGVAEVTLTNEAQEPHEAQLARVEGDRSKQDVLEALVTAIQGEAIPPWFVPAGGPYTTPPGESRSVTLDLEPGTYWVLDGDSPEEQGQGEPEPYALQGAIAEVSVEGGGEAAELPETDATIEMVEYDFETTGLTSGVNRVTMKNAGEEIHHTIAFPMREGASTNEVEKLFSGPPGEAPPGDGPPPVDFEGEVGTSVLSGGQSQIVELELQQGRYALVCFVSDNDGGPPHVAKGMLRAVEVR